MNSLTTSRRKGTNQLIVMEETSIVSIVTIEHVYSRANSGWRISSTQLIQKTGSLIVTHHSQPCHLAVLYF